MKNNFLLLLLFVVSIQVGCKKESAISPLPTPQTNLTSELTLTDSIGTRVSNNLYADIQLSGSKTELNLIYNGERELLKISLSTLNTGRYVINFNTKEHVFQYYIREYHTFGTYSYYNYYNMYKSVILNLKKVDLNKKEVELDFQFVAINNDTKKELNIKGNTHLYNIKLLSDYTPIVQLFYDKKGFITVNSNNKDIQHISTDGIGTFIRRYNNISSKGVIYGHKLHLKSNQDIEINFNYINGFEPGLYIIYKSRTNADLYGSKLLTENEYDKENFDFETLKVKGATSFTIPTYDGHPANEIDLDFDTYVRIN
jgi:hypothetical protein